MRFEPVTVALPIADRRRSLDFYRAALDLPTFGDELGGDGIPEPLQFEVNAGLRIMLVPRGGFDWVTGDHAVAAPGTSECLVSIAQRTDADVDALVARAEAAGATVVAGPGRQPWGYEGTFADPDGHLWSVTSGPPFV